MEQQADLKALLEEFREETEEIVEALLEDGSNPDAVYMNEHHLSAVILIL